MKIRLFFPWLSSESTENNSYIYAQFECTVEQLGESTKVYSSKTQYCSYGSFGSANKYVDRIKVNVNSGNAKSMFFCI
jgi:hypothetical protein